MERRYEKAYSISFLFLCLTNLGLATADLRVAVIDDYGTDTDGR
jgi:hypothetical protein